MPSPHPSSRRLALLAALLAVPGVRADTGEYLLIRERLNLQHVRLVEIRDDALVHLENGLWNTVNLADCIAILDTTRRPPFASEGMLVLNDGQRFPGEPISEFDTSDDELSWGHRWLGRIDVPLDEISTVLFRPGAHVPANGDGDTVLLVNGDRFHGFVVSLNDPVVIEVEGDGGQDLVEVPRVNVAAVRMVSMVKAPVDRRVWFDDGTVLDVDSIQVSDDGFVRLTSVMHAAGTKMPLLKLADVDSILLDPQRLVPLAALSPDRVGGPPTRYEIPQPVPLEPEASLDLSPIEYRGPLVARYVLPATCRRFAAEARIPDMAREWADFELIIRSNDEEVFRAHMSADNPYAAINVPLTGTELSIELTEGRHGPIQDRLILEYPMLLLDDE